jgi:spermidine synthase
MKTIYLSLWFISAAALAFQVTLTRFFALAQGHHLAFMAISLALLGAGASGTYLFLKPPAAVNLPRTLTIGSTLFACSVPAAYVAINYLPFDAYLIALEQTQVIWLTVYYLALTTPFFFSGLVIGAVLVTQPGKAGPLYSANLLGSALGPPLALLALATVGGPGTVFFCTLLGWLAAISSQLSSAKRHLLGFILYVAGVLLLLYFTIHPPGFFDVRLTPYKSLSQALLYPGSEIVFRKWNAFSRVDVIRSQGIRSAPGLSFTYPGELPPQLGLTVDGDNLSPITQPGPVSFSAYLPLALAFELRPNANTLILEPGGGLAVLAALQAGAPSVTVVQSNPTVIEAISSGYAELDHNLYADPRVTLVSDEPRSFLRRTDRQFDLIILPLTDSFRPVTAGAYTLNEDYRYTVQALAAALEHLAPNGLLMIERWLQLPPSEELRLWSTAIAALHYASDSTSVDPGAHLMALRSLQTTVISLARSPLSAHELAQIHQFAVERQFDLVWLPDVRPEETNRFSVVPGDPYYHTFADLLTTSDPPTFFATYPYTVAPPTDDHPFFFHFFKWQQTSEIWQSLGKTWQPFGGSGYLMLVALLALVVVLSAGLILLPLYWNQRRRNAPMMAEFSPIHVYAYLAYFALLGLGFLFVEIPLLQRFILYLGQPAYAFAVVTSALLLAAGIGSGQLAGRLSLRVVLPLIVLLTITYPWLLPYLFEATLRLPFAGRVVITVVALLPLGGLMGVPFPAGLNRLAQLAPGLTPWVWAVNGCASVISAVMAAMLALTWGFSVVLWGAAVAYTLAGMLLVWVNPTTR